MNDSVNIQEVFKDALNQTLSNYAEKSHSAISSLILRLVGEINPYMVVSPNGAEQLADEVFTNVISRDFIFNLCFNLIPRLSIDETEEAFNSVIKSFSYALAVADSSLPNTRYQTNLNMLPSEITKRLPSRAEIQELLEQNKWLVIVLMIIFYVNVSDFTKNIPNT